MEMKKTQRHLERRKMRKRKRKRFDQKQERKPDKVRCHTQTEDKD